MDTLHHALALGVRIEGAARTGDGHQALKFVNQLQDVLTDNETPYLYVLSGRYRGIAMVAAGNIDNAINILEETLAYANTHRAGLEMKPYIEQMLAKAVLMASRISSKVSG